MDEERYYGSLASSSFNGFRHSEAETHDLNRDCKTDANSCNTGRRNGVVCRPQIKELIKLKRCPSPLLGRPLEDYDCSENHDEPSPDTFIVLSRRAKNAPDQVQRFNKSKSLFVMGPQHPFRLLAIHILIHKYFEIFVILIILVNCIFLALDHPPEEAEYVFAAIYTLEMFLKIIAKGFVLHSYAYLRDSWNFLDFFVVIMGYVTLAPNIANFSGIRTIRVLRALRTISAMKGLKAMVNTLLRSMKMLSDVLVLFLFFLAVMALIGLQLFIGELRNKCVKNHPIHLNTSYQEYVSMEENWYMIDGSPAICGNSSTALPCPANYTCLSHVGPNPDDGYTNFDNIGWALVMSFQLLTMDYWENLYNKVIAAVGAGYVLYFIAAIFFCSFYLLNLVLAVVALSYEQEIKALVNESEKKKKRKESCSKLPSRRGDIENTTTN